MAKVKEEEVKEVSVKPDASNDKPTGKNKDGFEIGKPIEPDEYFAFIAKQRLKK